VGTLASELAPHASRASEPRIYADANIPNGVVAFMRTHLKWDVLFVLEHEDLRRARDVEHFRLARQLGRTLVTLDHDYENDRLFPPGEGAGVIVLTAPDEVRLRRLLTRADREVFRAAGAPALPLEGQKISWDSIGSDPLTPVE
jgi:predicted nuclease of predicted toxin-antitoxin system